MLTTDMTVFFEVGLKGADMRLQTRHNAFSFLECTLLTSEVLERTTERSCTRDFPQRLFFPYWCLVRNPFAKDRSQSHGHT